MYILPISEETFKLIQGEKSPKKVFVIMYSLYFISTEETYKNENQILLGIYNWN